MRRAPHQQHGTALSAKCVSASGTQVSVWVCLEDNVIRRDTGTLAFSPQTAGRGDVTGPTPQSTPLPHRRTVASCWGGAGFRTGSMKG